MPLFIKINESSGNIKKEPLDLSVTYRQLARLQNNHSCICKVVAISANANKLHIDYFIGSNSCSCCDISTAHNIHVVCSNELTIFAFVKVVFFVKKFRLCPAFSILLCLTFALSFLLFLFLFSSP